VSLQLIEKSKGGGWSVVPDRATRPKITQKRANSPNAHIFVDAAAWCLNLVSTSSKDVEDYRAEFSGI
jgi:hypothetical protein